MRRELPLPAEELATLREGEWYPLGIPGRQIDHRVPYNKTLDALKLVEELMRTRGRAALVVANPPTPRRTPEEARLIGLQDLAFYEGVQDLLFELSGQEESNPLNRLPVMLMSDFEKVPGFQEKRAAVTQLFESNVEFREAVYRCVPRNLRPRKHHDKTYTDLAALPNDSAFREARAQADYVIYQISMVLFIGGKKMGHAREKPYNEATQMAQGLLPSTEDGTPVQFETVELSGSLGEVPYRATQEMDPRKVPGVISAYGFMEVYDGNMKQLIARRRPLIDGLARQLKEMEAAGVYHHHEVLLRCARESIHRLALDMIELHKELSNSMIIVDELALALRRKVTAQLDDHPKIGWQDREAVIASYLCQQAKESILSMTTGPGVLERFLVDRTGILDVLEGRAGEETLPKTAGRWLPFEIEPRSFQTPYSYVPFANSALMHGPGAPFEKRANLSGMDPLVNRTARWVVPYRTFEALLFTPIVRPDLIQKTEDIEATIESIANPPQKVRWQIFDEFLETIEGTPLEDFYQLWLTIFTRRNVATPAPLSPEFLRSAQAERTRQLLAHPCFSEAFRRDFTFILEGH